ncbi:diaminopimelate decarboxylase [Paenibacillus cellulosilyticus]|uniref:Diaminopimelate decarboxylase n=1 Tax=Paenibacillus cellulosilyticus TaxID=375489 RepID=A0A2V2YWW0_9BACL|nr:decarboxylase [Paenibacillus cellulosilyticus]PWW06133.1 diaminopimelate decarboxylase [Paenibacillus cellulosilyticus]QKS43096.1 type III PLP-dependent enzyme [Paenibacillus cellulosilyticus]
MDFRTLADSYGTPSYIYQLQEVDRSCDALKSALPAGSVIYYSFKANPHPGVAARLAAHGCHAELSSVGEAAAMTQAGFEPSQCIYTGPGKSIKEMEAAIQHGILLFSVESLRELAKLSELAVKHGVKLQAIIRVNPSYSITGSGLSMTGVSSQFGIDEDILLREYRDAVRAEAISVIGFHIFNGSNISSPELLLTNFIQSIDTAVRMAEALQIDLQLLDLGGGFGSLYAKIGERIDFSGIKAPLEQYLDEALPGWRNGSPQIAFESGRYLVGPSGTFLSSVEDVKISRGSKFTILDSGIHHLSGMTGSGRIPKVGMDFIPASTNASRSEDEKATVVGPLCTPLDYFVRDGNVPEARPGDLMTITNVGAYGLTASLIGFLSREAPIEIVCDGDEVVSASRITLVRAEGKIEVGSTV